MLTLQPCPFCGALPVIRVYEYYTGCHTARLSCPCGISYQTTIQPTRQSAELAVHDHWNLRRRYK